ncbi:SDR family oxidoreductase [Azospirillum sp. SYSU D00513]|uniref:SDR family oxidoreductase n=1 Tax=Azospirillum sp. SYSU D00513 TaxID=2812561 RepID=UPI001A95F5BE|nr:SDR family oxidoreductase [Azospirillum sp. SYSU D00513]
MSVRLKPIDEQVIVITGATSGIGLVTARMAAERGARVVLAARDREALAQVADEIRRNGGQAVHCVADVADEIEMRQVAATALRAYDGFDSWVNNAGVSIYGRIADVPMEDHRRLFETNYWGVVIGSRIAMQHLRRDGGSIVNVGSTLSDRAIPLQGPYCATKHAVKAFTDSLRMELEAEGAPVSVTLIKPAAIDTMYEAHAKNFLDTEPSNPPPVYAPELVAEGILHAVETPVRDLYIGGAAKMFSLAETFAPRLTDYVMERQLTRMQRSGGMKRPRNDALHAPGEDGIDRARRHGFVRETSLYTAAQMHPWVSAALVAGFGILAGAAVRRGWTRQDGTAARDGQHAGRHADLPGRHRTLGHNAKPAHVATEEREVVFRD